MAEGEAVKWTAIVLTCMNKKWTQVLQRELDLRQSKGQIDKDTFLLAIEDPKAGVGSGGATINALLTVAEYISAQKGYTVLNEDILRDAKILILHHGRSYAYDICGRPFTTLPTKYKNTDHDTLVCMIDHLIKVISEKLAVKAGPGVWVSSTDMALTVPDDAVIEWEDCDTCAVTVPSSPNYCTNHGVYKLDKQGYVEDILFRVKVSEMDACLRPDGAVPMVCGIVFFSPAITEKFLAFHTKPPLDACTYFGVDSGEKPIKLSLYFDVMLAMCSGVDSRSFRSGERSGSYGKQSSMGDIKNMRMARTILWNDLHGFKVKACMIESGSCIYPKTVIEHKKNLMERWLEPCFPQSVLTWNNITHSFIQNSENIDPSCTIINSVIEGNVKVGPKSLITHSHIQGTIGIGKDSFISGLCTDPELMEDVHLPDSTIIQCYKVFIPTLDKPITVITAHGRFDVVEMPSWKSVSTFCNDPWLVFLARTGILKEELWGQEMEEDERTIYTARVFPIFHSHHKVGVDDILWLLGTVDDNDDRDLLKRWRASWRLSLKEIQELADLEQEFEFRRKLFYSVGEREISTAMTMQRNAGFRSLYNSAVVDGYCEGLMNTLDEVLAENTSDLQVGIAARTMANIADILGCMAGPKGGLRSGPAANTTWSKAFHYLEKKDIATGIRALAEERKEWQDRPDKLIRAARHYEGAAQILICHAVKTARQFYNISPTDMVPFGYWVVAECPSRIDISGGWSDTPPITYEHGGAVAIVSLKLGNKKPVGAKTRRIKEPKIVFVLHGKSGVQEVVCQELSDLADYYQPHSTGALLKAAFICGEIVDLKSKASLKDQLMSNYKGGFEFHSWADMPHGSGMGTSSILSGAVLAAIMKVAGKKFDCDSLVHMVLYLEQLLTCGGGWQDQVGGLAGGIVLGLSEAKLPLHVEIKKLDISEEVIKAFNERLVLIYTGKTRLARNILQEVLRNWYARNPKIVETEDKLVSLAHQCVQYFKEGDFPKLGECMNQYWEMKKVMAPGSEPEFVSKLMTMLRPHSFGMSMAGAGGGGFMYVLAKDLASQQKIKQIVGELENTEGCEVYDASVDPDGLVVRVVKEEEEEELEENEQDNEEEDLTDYYSQPEIFPEDGVKNVELKNNTEGCEVYDASVDPDGLVVRVVKEEEEEELEENEQDNEEEDLTDYYSQPEIFPEDGVKNVELKNVECNNNVTERGDGR